MRTQSVKRKTKNRKKTLQKKNVRSKRVKRTRVKRTRVKRTRVKRTRVKKSKLKQISRGGYIVKRSKGNRRLRGGVRQSRTRGDRYDALPRNAVGFKAKRSPYNPKQQRIMDELNEAAEVQRLQGIVNSAWSEGDQVGVRMSKQKAIELLAEAKIVAAEGAQARAQAEEEEEEERVLLESVPPTESGDPGDWVDAPETRSLPFDLRYALPLITDKVVSSVKTMADSVKTKADSVKTRVTGARAQGELDAPLYDEMEDPLNPRRMARERSDGS